MAQIKIRVRQASGTFRGGLFKDGPGYANRWMGAPKPHLQEEMVCTGQIESGEWFLLEHVLQSQLVGEEENNSRFDPESHACRRTPVQALHWFMQQAFGPPPALVERVRQFAVGWKRLCATPSARVLLQTLITRKFVDADDSLLLGPAQEDLQLLRDLDLVHIASGGKDSFFADSEAKDMGVDGYVSWMNGHLDRVGEALRSGSDSQGSVQKDKSPSQSPKVPTWAEIDVIRRQLKRQRVDAAREDMQDLFSLWQETTDLLFRSNVGDDARVEELSFLRSITFRLAVLAHKSNRVRDRLHRLNSILRTLMPREWFADPALRSQVADAVHSANVEVEEIYFAWVQRSDPTYHPAPDITQIVRDQSQSLGTGIQLPQPSRRIRRIQINIDNAGYDCLCVAWDQSDPAHRERPTWRELATAVQKALGLTTKISSTITALKSRAPRTKEKWDAIGREIAKEKAERVALRRK